MADSGLQPTAGAEVDTLVNDIFTGYLICSEEQQQISQVFLSRQSFDKVLNSSEQFWIITVGTVHARHQLD
jgi:hypothetical protein